MVKYHHKLCVTLYRGFRQSCKILKRETPTAHADFKGLGCAVAFLIVYKIARFHKSFVDVDECADGTGGCAQTCTNSNGSYTCSCVSGTILSIDNLNCEGKIMLQSNNKYYPELCVQILMNVPQTMEGVHRYVLTMIVILCALVTCGTDWL